MGQPEIIQILNGVQGVASSNPATPTKDTSKGQPY
jgi:hypothetical protein